MAGDLLATVLRDEIRSQLREAAAKVLHQVCVSHWRTLDQGMNTRGATFHGWDAHLEAAGLMVEAQRDIVLAYAVEREKAMRERCAKAVEAELARVGLQNHALWENGMVWAVGVVRAVPVDGEGTPEPKGQTP